MNIDISDMRECFFDDMLVDTEKTTAEFRLHRPVRKNTVLVHDEVWEGDNCCYHNFFWDDGVYRMYYLGASTFKASGMFVDDVSVCYAESKDGINWVKPKLNICKVNGSYDNNIILDLSMVHHGHSIDNFMVFKDNNPDCGDDERYKAILRLGDDGDDGLYYMFSADGIHFSWGGTLTTEGNFDSLNVAFWDEKSHRYRCYFRGYHMPGDTAVGVNTDENNIRDIRYMESTDFIHWTKPRLIEFGDNREISLYTNCVQNYQRAKQILIGFPSRYLFRREWNGSFDELPGRERRIERMKRYKRYGLVLTDCIFMTSRDGINFKRYNEAIMTPGPEGEINWVYGDCYPARGFIETKSEIEGAAGELSMLVPEGEWSGRPTRLVRYSIRCDGFRSAHSDESEKTLVTKPFIFSGSDLFVNFETSALGYMYFTLVDKDGNRYESEETFGNNIDRKVYFDAGVIKRLSGKPVTLEVRMCDSDLYSIMFR